jgi:hypothetical protein
LVSARPKLAEKDADPVTPRSTPRVAGPIAAGNLPAAWAASPTLTERIRPPRQYLLVGGKQATGAIGALEDFEAVFREHFAPVYRFIARRVGTALAEDLAAEVFATAYRRRAAYQPERGSLRSWLYGIAANVVRGHWRDEQQLLELDARVARDFLGLPPAVQFADTADER